MSFKRPFCVSPTSQQVQPDKVSKQTKTSSKLSTCQVCGDKANIINYGALACQSCKTFFRRNGFLPESVRPCSHNKKCEMRIDTRRNCIACRLAKCLSVGMCPDLIRKPERHSSKSLSSSKFISTEPTVSKQVMSAQQLTILNLLHNDRPLTASQYTVLSNVVYAHDIFSAMPHVRHIIKPLSTLSAPMHFDETNVLEIVTLIYNSMQSFISSPPDFRILTVSEQTSLFERNLHGIAALHAVSVYRETDIINNQTCMELFVTIYGLEMMIQIKRISIQLDLDSTIVKLMLIVLTFSSNCFIVDTHENIHNDSLLYGTHRLLGSQNVYVDLLWKYMLYQYGYDNSVLRFARLMVLFLDLIKYSAKAYTNNATHRKLVQDFVKKTVQSLVNGNNVQVSLWGKIC